MSPLLEVTEDTPPDMLTGSMDLRLVLLDGTRVRMSVDRRTPMMDLLVQVTTAYKISPAGNVLQPYGESGILPYKPSTPIGALDTWIVHIVPKNQAIQNPSNKINLKQLIPPFEQTLRFQVNLPRNQLYVTRVSGRCSMRDILLQACKEKNLDHTKYTVRHPKHLDKALCDEMSIAEYGHNQVTMISLKNLPTSVSTDDILMMNKYKAQSDSGSGSAASSSVSPVPPVVQPSKPVRKRRPAPKPPAPQQKQSQNETIICHSRTSSDSSGYHEASVLSESPDSNNSSLPDSLPRRSKLPPAEPKGNTVESKLSRSLSNLHQASTSVASCSGLKPAQSTSCLVQARKKKPAPPPPLAIAEEKEEKSATLPAGARLLDNQSEETDAPLTNGISHRSPSPIDDQDYNAIKLDGRTPPIACKHRNSPVVNSIVEVRPFSPSNIKGLNSLSGSVSSLNTTVSDKKIPPGLVKRLSQQLFDVSEIPQAPIILKNSEGNVLNSVKKYENLKSSPFVSKEKIEQKINSVFSPTRFAERKKSVAPLDAVSIFPLSVMEELEAKLACTPHKINVKKLLQRFESGNSVDSNCLELLKINFGTSDKDRIDTFCNNNDFTILNENSCLQNISETSCDSPNTNPSTPDSYISKYSCFRGSNNLTPNLENISQQTSPYIMLPPVIQNNTMTFSCSGLSGNAEIPYKTNLIDENIETYINMIDESLTENGTTDVPFESNEASQDIINTINEENNEQIYNLYADIDPLRKVKEEIEDKAENGKEYQYPKENILNSLGNSDNLSDDSSEENGKTLLYHDNAKFEKENFNNNTMLLESPVKVDTLQNSQENIQSNASINDNIIHTGSNHSIENENKVLDSNFNIILPAVIEHETLNGVLSYSGVQENEVAPCDNKKSFTEPKVCRKGSLSSVVSYESLKFSPNIINKSQKLPITDRRQSLSSIMSYESGIYESMKPIPEEMTELSIVNEELNENHKIQLNGKTKQKSVTFCECESIKETSSEDGSLKSFKKKKSFSSPLQLDFLKRKGKTLFGRRRKKASISDWNHTDSIKPENICNCAEPDPVFVRVPKTPPSRKAAFKLKRNESPSSDTSDHTYMAMDSFKAQHLTNNNIDSSEAQLVQDKLNELLNSRPEEFL